MTMEERPSGIEDGSPVISTGAPVNSSTLLLAKSSSKQYGTTDASYPLQRPGKRSFDVAFLVAPDEKLISRRQSEKLASLQQYCASRLMTDAIRSHQLVSRDEHSDDSRESELSDRAPQNLTIKHFADSEHHHHHHHHNAKYGKTVQSSPSPPSAFQRRKLFEDGEAKGTCDGISCSGDSRSAFTKVSLATQRSPNGIGFDDGTASPRSSSSVSPDVIAYQNSLSPPIGPANPGNHLRTAGCFPSKIATAYPFLMSSSPERQQQPQQQSPPPKVSRPELPSAVYPSLPYNPLSVFPPIGDALVRPRLLAAASLLPSSLAALALPAQNVCAKCNLSFRMTSDLVYHMRSHHKSEGQGEAARRRREEKLRCPVCDESFRERHHLTRHMTAHQDKESDAVLDQAEVAKRRGAAAATAALVHSGK
ncbi:uncharacterized protein LOC106636168 [Copidosoma floridanum]|uniref:uncharacterized protein LOC106636168 n=1 Tax=Copidosoma floridanum TaxID=29053 RepID=UPI0006C9AD43|nr:uncharacterized protein LOC106636168 [Copidosoma floridanum]